MPTGPFRSLGAWPVLAHDGTPSERLARITIVKATHAWIKYTRCDTGARLHHGKIWRDECMRACVSVGGFQYVCAPR